MKKKNRIIFAVAACLSLVVIGIYIFFHFFAGPLSAKMYEGNGTSYGDYLSNEVDFKLYYYGDLLKMSDNLEKEMINTLDFDSFDMDHDFVYLVINDWKSNSVVAEDDIDKLVDFANKNNNFTFIYLGNKAFDELKKNIPEFQPTDSDLSVVYTVCYGDRICGYGVFSTSDLQRTESGNAPMDAVEVEMVRLVKSSLNE